MDSDNNKRPCPCCQKLLDRIALQLELHYAEGDGEGVDVDDGEVEGNANPMVDDAGEHIEDAEDASDGEAIHTGDGVGVGNLDAEEPVQPVIEPAPNDDNLFVHNAGADIPLELAHGLCRNLPVTIEDWSEPTPDAEGEFYDNDNDNKPVDGPDHMS
ncbi:hypothetical protein FRC10_009229 [Ceratobasidium sp. 414]|nr:hypothetical protein FRC10_009229 [Ceratobasidium sp. 414]